MEKESLAALISQFSEWERSQNSEITIAQRVAEKNKTDKSVYTQEKIYQVWSILNYKYERILTLLLPRLYASIHADDAE